ncbi:ankyrin repeat, SAM and basic leucine zipper domain-containing protein 1 [Menidia menidia]
MDFFPAGDETDTSNDDWDIGSFSDEKHSCTKDLDTVVLRAEDDVSVLQRAINEGDIDAVGQLLENGVNVEIRLGFEWTPLMHAANMANYELAKFLLDRGASANFSKDKWTVLMASCTASASEDKIAHCVELLLSRNADPNMVDGSQMTCLMLAAREGHSKIINQLVSHGAQIDSQDSNGYTALSIAAQYGREEAVLKLLQLGADKTIRTETGKSPADLSEIFRHAQITRILTTSSSISAVQAINSMDETLSKFFKTNSNFPSSGESATKFDDLELLLHGLDLGYLVDIMTENDITWSYLLTMEKEDFERIGVKNPVDQQKVLSAVKQIHLDKVDLDMISQIGSACTGNEDLQSFLISVNQQCCYLIEMIQDVIIRFPRQSSQVVFSLDPNKEAQTICNQLIVQTKDLQKEVICLRNLLSQTDESEDSFQVRQPNSPKKWWGSLTRMTVSTLGAAVLLLLYKVARGKGYLQMCRRIF